MHVLLKLSRKELPNKIIERIARLINNKFYLYYM